MNHLVRPTVNLRRSRSLAEKLQQSDADIVPDWLRVLSIVSLVLGFVCAGIIAVDEFRHPQHM